MSNKMLIDASHPEETRVVVLRGNRVEEFDFEAADRQQLRGNIYLAKVTRVEPSLQAAFVEYGGNRHGFLAFSEIHPDYYQIPVADRQALIDEQAEEAAAEAAAEAEADKAADARAAAEASADDASVTETAEHGDNDDHGGLSVIEEPEAVEDVGSADAMEEVPERRKPRPRQYKIQEVIKRRQVLLVQVVKEERGNKGAALTTYLSLAGRYSVLMPNTARGGGISRKITNAVDRKRLKAVASDLDVPEGMGVILRTAGANRTKTEIKRDFEYLLRLWENVRELTLRSTAPKLVYEEGSLIKRSIRDLYSREIDQILVSGDDAYREAKDFMRMLMPSHAKNVQAYRDGTPIFSRSGVELQLDAMFSPQVTLKSGGYIVINQTEALVSIDVNSGRSTREHSIEDTALNTNLEASEEIARQLRLRDLAGLIVIDFIDMEEKRNNRSVERKLKDCLRADRARIQVGRISHFGLLEMSRQRIRTGVLESSVVACPHCRGTGQVRSISSLSLQILRALEDYLLKHSSHDLIVRTRPEVALYVLNQKRRHLAQLEERFGLSISLSTETPPDGGGYLIERGDPVIERPQLQAPVAMSNVAPEPEVDEEETDYEADAELQADAEENGSEAQESGGSERRRKRRRRRGGGGEAREARVDTQGEQGEPGGESDEAEEDDHGQSEIRADEEGDQDSEGRRRRRGRRGGRRRGRGRENGNGAGHYEHDRVGGTEGADTDVVAAEAIDNAAIDSFAPVSADETIAPAAQEPERYAAEPAYEAPDELAGDAAEPAGDHHAEEIEALTEAVAEREEEHASAPEPDQAPPPAPEPEDDSRPKRSGWWSRRSFF